MGVTDWGEINQPLGGPALGGAGGWADSVAQALDNSDETVDARLATLEAAMEALIATAQGAADAADANADGRVAKTGDTMTGALIVPTPTATGQAATKGYVDTHQGISRAGLASVTFSNVDGNAVAVIPVTAPAITGRAYVPMVQVEQGFAQWLKDNGYGDALLYATMSAAMTQIEIVLRTSDAEFTGGGAEIYWQVTMVSV